MRIRTPRWPPLDPDDERIARAERVTLRRTDDPENCREVFTVSAAPPVVMVSRELVEQIDERGRWDVACPITFEGDVMRWEFENCWARYSIAGYEHLRDVIVCERLGSLS